MAGDVVVKGALMRRRPRMVARRKSRNPPTVTGDWCGAGEPTTCPGATSGPEDAHGPRGNHLRR